MQPPASLSDIQLRLHTNVLARARPHYESLEGRRRLYSLAVHPLRMTIAAYYILALSERGNPRVI